MKVFISYSHKDEGHRNNLVTHLAPLKRDGVIEVWHDRKISAGREWADQIDENLEQASIILLLISSDFLASDYCYDREMSRALEKHHNREARVIPIIIRSVDWHTAPFVMLQALPQDGKPIASWKNNDEAWTNVAKGIRQVVQELSGQTNPSANQRPDKHHKPLLNVPLERNPFFTGREDILEEIRVALVSTGKAAFTGLGGIGKTQTAGEYAFRHIEDYQHIFWVKAESKETLTSDFAQLASLLNLPEKQVQDQQEIVKAVQRWLQRHDHWLLILDNADDLLLIQPFVQGLQSGHILLTTRAQATGTISKVEVQKLPEQEGAVFLLRRAKLITIDTSYDTISQELQTPALAIGRELDGLPLALDQAGAYIEATHCGLAAYFELYKSHGIELLKERGLFAPGHPDPVATTWVLSFQKIEQANPAAAELLRFCAFLHPDGIPEELITEGASELGPVLGPVAKNPISFNQAIGKILKFSLIHRDMNNKTLDIHRLVQAVILKSLDDEAQHQWIERQVRAMDRVIPKIELENWPQCERLLTQAQQCAMLISIKNLTLPEGALVLHETGYYLTERARYDEAEPLYQRALAISEQTLGSLHDDVANCLLGLGGLYYRQGKYAKAEPLYQRALAIREQSWGPAHTKVASCLNALALLYSDQGKYALAEPLFERALSIEEQGGSTHPEVATKLNNLATLYQQQGKYAEAEPLHQRALSIREQALGPKHPHVATSLSNLGLVYHDLKNYLKAEVFYERALTISEEALGSLHPNVATTLNNLALLHQRQGNYKKAEAFLLRVLIIWEHALGPTHPSVGTGLNNLAWLYHQEGNFAKAKPIYKRAIGISEERLGPNHPNTIQGRRNYEDLLKKIKRKTKKVKRGKYK